MNRNTKGVICWFVLTVVLTIASGIVFGDVLSVLLPVAVCLSAMTGREIWQYKTRQAQIFEWDDIARYTLVILAACVLTDFVLVTTGVVE